MMLMSAALGSVTMMAVAQTRTAEAEQNVSLSYQSAFDGYRSMEEVTNPPSIETWREANETVAKVGGHAGVVKATQPVGNAKDSGHASHGGHSGHAMGKPAPTPDSEGATSAAPATPAKPSPHQGH